MTDDSDSARSSAEPKKADVAEFMPAFYDELKEVAEKLFRKQPASHTLQPTALVNEAFLRLMKKAELECKSDTHFFSVAAQAMGQILTDHFRRRSAAKRGGARPRLALDDDDLSSEDSEVDLLDLMEALEKFSRLNPRHCKIVTLRYFGGKTIEEVAGELEVSMRPVEADWRLARAWLRSELSKS